MNSQSAANQQPTNSNQHQQTSINISQPTSKNYSVTFYNNLRCGQHILYVPILSTDGVHLKPQPWNMHRTDKQTDRQTYDHIKKRTDGQIDRETPSLPSPS